MKEKPLKISKLDAARRQLETALRLYFNEGDPVSIHTLAFAAERILSDVDRARGGTGFLEHQVLKVRPGKEAEGHRIVHEAANFFKHANRDSDAVLDFNQGATQVFLLSACEAYKQLTGERVPIFTVYAWWFLSGPPGIGTEDLLDSPTLEKVAILRKAYPDATRQSFLRDLLPRASKLD